MKVERMKYRSIGFSGTLTLMSTMISTIIGIAVWLQLPLFITLKTIGILVLYSIIGLIAEDLRGLDDLMRSIYDITTTKSSLSLKERQTMIISHVEAAIDQWVSLWYFYDKIVKSGEQTNGSIPYVDRKDLLISLLKKIPDGELNPYQVLSIYGYFTYSVIFYIAEISINPIIDGLIIIGVLIVLLLFNGKMVGMGKFFVKIFKTLLPTSEDQLTHQLELLKQFIIQGNHIYYMLDLKQDM